MPSLPLPPHSPRWRALPLVVLGLLLNCAAVSAATVRAYIQPERAQTGQVVTYVIAVQNGTVQNLPQLRLPAQVGMNSGVSTSQNIEIRGNQRVFATQLAWGVAGTEPGEFVIPPQEVLVNGEVLKTNEVRLVVTEAPTVPGAPNASDDSLTPLFQIEVGKTEFYQGEVVPITASFYVPRRNVAMRRIGLIEVNKNDFAIARFPQQSDQTETVINGVGYMVITYRSVLSALHPGDLKVGPASCEVLFDVMEEDPRQMRRGMPFGMGLAMGGGETRKQVLKSLEIKVKVLPLPAEGKPATFAGAVGDFNLTATATPADLAVGDPLAVDLTVEGVGNFEALTPPKLTPPDGWKPYPPRRYNVDGPVDPNLTPTAQRRIGYSMVFVPEKVQTHLPSFELSYFSPTQKKYVTTQTAPIPLSIKPGTAVAGTTDVAGAAGTGEAPKPPPVQQPKPNITDILTNLPDKAHWLNTLAAARPPLTSSSRFWALQSIPAALVILAALFAWFRRSRQEAAAGMRGELRQLWQGLEQRDIDDRTFLQRAAHFIHRTSPGDTQPEELRAILQRYESLSFTATHAPDAALGKAERESILAKLAPLLKKSAVWAVMLALAAGSAATAADESPDEVYRQAREALEKGKFTSAQYLAESLTKRTPPALSAEVFALIGNARYRQEDKGRAALWYQRAQLLDPANAEVRQNLRHLDEETRFFRFRGDSMLAEWSLLLPKNAWIITATAGAWAVVLALGLIILRGRKSWVLVVVMVLVGLIVFVPTATLAAVRPAPDARVKDIMVITAKEMAYSAATQTSGSVIDLPPGSQVRLLEKRGAWSYVEVPSGTEPVRGWVETAAYTPLWPWSPALVP